MSKHTKNTQIDFDAVEYWGLFFDAALNPSQCIWLGRDTEKWYLDKSYCPTAHRDWVATLAENIDIAHVGGNDDDLRDKKEFIDAMIGVFGETIYVIIDEDGRSWIDGLD